MTAGRLLIVEPLGGLANRLRVVASAELTARAAGRELRVRWRVDAGCGARWDELFENDLRFWSGPPPPDAHRYEGEPVNFAIPGPGDVVEDLSPVTFVRTCFNFKPRTLPLASFVAAKGDFYRQLVPLAAIRERVETLVARELAGRPTVGVHIRRGDLVLAGERPERISPTSRFVRRMRELVAADAATRFFVATDDRDEEARLRDEFPGRIVTLPKGEPRRDTREPMQEALADWLLLARTRLVLRSAGTSFSREAAIAGGVPRETVKRPLWPYDRRRYWIEAWRRRVAVIRRRIFGALGALSAGSPD